MDLAEKTKMRRREGTGELMEGEMPTKSWLEKHSGGIMLPKRRRATDPGLEEDEVEAVKARERQQWHKEAERVVELLKDNLDLPILRGAEESIDPEEFMRTAIGGYRASTLRKRLREWRKYLTWLEIVHEVRWPSRRAHAID